MTIDIQENDSGRRTIDSDIDFTSIKNLLDDLPKGSSSTMAFEPDYMQPGEGHTAFMVNAICRPGDEKITESCAARTLYYQLREYLERRKGLVHIRIPFEQEIVPASLITEFCEDGPEIYSITNQRCKMDHNFVSIKAYVRFYRERI